PPTDLGLQIADVSAATAQPLLTESPLPCPTPTCDLMVSVLGRHPAWSPDGERLVVADLTVPTVSGAAVTVDGRGALAVVDVAGGANGPAAVASNPVLLTRPAVLATERDAGAVDRIWREVASAAEPAWSPNGTRIAFSGTAAGEAVARDLWTIAVDGSDLVRVTNDPTRQTDPAWQPAPAPGLTVAASEPAPSVGTTVTFTATVVPGTTAPLGATRVTFTLPEQLANPSASGCQVFGDAVTCPVPPLLLGTSHDVVITVDVVDEGEATVDVALTYPDDSVVADTSVTLTPVLVLTRPRLAFTSEGTDVASSTVDGPTDDPSSTPEPDAPVFPARTDRRYESAGPYREYLGLRAAGQLTAVVPGIESPDRAAFVSDGDLTYSAGQDAGDVYVDLDEGPSARPHRITCDADVEQHPVVSPDNEWVAWAVDTGADGLDVVAAVIPYDDEDAVEQACDGGLEVVTIAGGPGDQTWPTWVPATGSLVYSGSTAPGEPADLYLVQDPLSGEPTTVRLTDTPSDESQPAAVSLPTRDGGTASVIALRTTAFRPDGSLGFLVCQPWYDCTEESYGAVIDAYAASPVASVQGSEPAWMPAPSWWSPVDNAEMTLAFTSTTGDEAGDVWVGTWRVGLDPSTEESVATYVDQDRAVSEPGVAASFPSWLSLWQGFPSASADLSLTTSDGDGDVEDVHAPDFTERRAVQAGDWFYSDGSTELDERQPAYSGDGERLAYSVDVEVPCVDGEVDDCGPGYPRVRAIGVSDWRGDGTQVLAYDRAPHDLDVDPVWSPDSTTIAFVRYSLRSEGDPATSAAPEGYRPGRVMLLDVATGTVTPLLPDEDDPNADDAVTSQRDPAFSPDGRTIALTLSRDPWAGAPQELGVVLVDVATLAAAPLTVLPPTDCPLSVLCQARPVTGRHPTWSPDGTRLALADVTVAQPVGSALRFDGRGR
ncbi:MAG TPA: hypothetical protein DHV14_11370, partial [Micrococcales bacterium]|uniref:hypothetical protein n=1 Tax=Miniimonas arenae TaxID=676201 RepID=UPI000EEC9E78